MNDEFRGSIHKELMAGDRSMAAKYSEIFPGRKGLWNLLKYEFITSCVSGAPGALGYLLRKVFFPRLFKAVGRGCVFGRGITIRHPHKISVGAESFIDDGAVLDAKGAANEGIVIGENAYIGRNAILSCKEGSIYPRRLLQHLRQLHHPLGDRGPAGEVLFPGRELLPRGRRQPQLRGHLDARHVPAVAHQGRDSHRRRRLARGGSLVLDGVDHRPDQRRRRRLGGHGARPGVSRSPGAPASSRSTTAAKPKRDLTDAPL